MQVEKRKVGQFFLYLGLILLVIFFASDQAQHPAYGYFFAGAGLVFLGGYLMWRDRPPVEPNTERFRTLRKIREQQKKRAEEKAKKKK
jgi:hypothetical protein